MTGSTPAAPDRGERSGGFKFEWHKKFTATKGLTVGELYAGGAIFDRADKHGANARLSAESLADTTGVSLSTAKRGIAGLQKRGLVAQTSKGGRTGDGRAFASVFALLLPQSVTSDTLTQSVTGDTLSDSQSVSRPSQSVNCAPQSVTTDTPSDQLPSDQLPSDQLGGVVALVDARETTAIRPASIFIEKNQPFIPEDKKNTAPRYAEWQHLLRRDLIVELEDIAQQIVDENNLAGLTDLADDAVRSTVDWLLTAYSESTRPQTRNGIHIWLMEIRPEPDVPLFQSVLSTFHRRAS